MPVYRQNCNQLKSLLGIETQLTIGWNLLNTYCNQLKSLLGIETDSSYPQELPEPLQSTKIPIRD